MSTAALPRFLLGALLPFLSTPYLPEPSLRFVPVTLRTPTVIDYFGWLNFRPLFVPRLGGFWLSWDTVSHMDAWFSWVSEVTSGESARSIAAKIGASRSSISLQPSSRRPSAAVVFLIAREYDADVLSGLVAAGWLAGDDVDRIRERILLGMPTRALIAELHARGERAPRRRSVDDPPTDPTEWPARGK